MIRQSRTVFFTDLGKYSAAHWAIRLCERLAVVPVDYNRKIERAFGMGMYVMSAA